MAGLIQTGLKTALILLIAGSAAYAHALTTVTTNDFTITGIKTVDLTGFTFDATMNVSQRGILPVTVDKANYNVTRSGTNQRLANGTLSGFTVPRRSSTTVPLTVNGEWVNTPTNAARTLLDDNPSVDITATIFITVGPITVDTTHTTTKELRGDQRSEDEQEPITEENPPRQELPADEPPQNTSDPLRPSQLI